MTYDSLEILQNFHREKKLNYPLLKDESAKHVAAFGILNETYKPGDPGYGVPHPGVIFIDNEGVVRAKFAAPGFRERPSFDVIYKSMQN